MLSLYDRANKINFQRIEARESQLNYESYIGFVSSHLSNLIQLRNEMRCDYCTEESLSSQSW
jgi:hypothetical protein